MGFYKESDAKKATRKITYEKDKKEAKKILRYLLFYFSVIFILSIVSYLFDLALYLRNNNTTGGLWYGPLQYIPFYMIIGYMIFPLSFIYNYFINNFLPEKNYMRILAGLFAAIFFGFFLSHDFIFGYYIGKYRQLKNILALGVSGVCVEFLRIWVVSFKYKTQKY